MRPVGGRIFTHRLTDAEIACDSVLIGPDLVVLDMLIDDGVTVVDRAGRPLAARAYFGFEDDDRAEMLEERGIDPEDAVLLPMWLLSDCLAGDIIGVRISGTEEDPEICVVPVATGDIAEMHGDLGDRVHAELTARSMPNAAASPAEATARGSADDAMPGFADLHDLVARLCADDPELFTAPLPPLGEMLTDAGYVVIDDDVLPVGVDAESWRVTRDAGRVAGRYGLPAPGALAVAIISNKIRWASDLLADSDAYDGAAGDAGSDDDSTETDSDWSPPADLLETLAEPDVAEALLAEALGSDVEPAVLLGAIAEDWEPIAPRRARVALRWLRSRCNERLGHPQLAEEDLHAARALDSGWPPVLEDLARYASERGDAASAIALLRQAGVPEDDGELSFLLGLASPARPDLGRNQPCWCGSGRKYKVCHLGREDLPLADRATWLYRKAVRYLESGPHRYRIMTLAQIRSMYDTSFDALLKALAEPLIEDALLFEGGVAADYAAERGYLLPDDERALLDQWLLTTRSVYEVEEVRYGRGLTVRDVRTGDQHDIAEKTATRQIKKGMRLLMRLAPVDGGVGGDAAGGDRDGQPWQIFGGAESVGMHQEQSAIALCDALDAGEAGPMELVEFATRRFAPPTLHTTDGAALVQCTARYKAEDSDAAASFLAGRFNDDGDGHYTLTDGDGPFPTVLAHLELHDDELTVETMNEKRLADVQRELESMGGLTLLDVQRVPATEMLQRASASGPRSVAAGRGQRAARARRTIL